MKITKTNTQMIAKHPCRNCISYPSCSAFIKTVKYGHQTTTLRHKCKILDDYIHSGIVFYRILKTYHIFKLDLKIYGSREYLLKQVERIKNERSV